jgi:hypothetical protein
MRRILVLIILAVSAFGWYRVRAAQEAAQFMPADTTPVLVPAGTMISAVVRHRIPESAAPGDTIVAYVQDHVFVDGRTAVRSGAQLNGHIEKVSVSGNTARASFRVDCLLTNGLMLTIETRGITAEIPVRSEPEILTAALKALMGAMMGAAIGAESRDPRMVDRALIEGVATSIPEEIEVPIALTLVRTLEIRNPRQDSN